MKKWYTYIVYVSLFFLVVTLFQADYLKIPEIKSIKLLILSLFFLFLGVFLDALAWHKSLTVFGFTKHSYLSSLSSMGLSIFGKYIPGKIWTVIGRSSYMVKKYNYNEKQVSMISLIAQLISLWVGIILGSIIFLFISQTGNWIAIISFIWIFLSLLLFTNFFYIIIEFILLSILKVNIDLLKLNIKDIIRIIPWYVILWITWCFAFYLLINSQIDFYLPIWVGLAFSIACTIGVLAIIFPGGIGIRESFLAFIFLILGFEQEIVYTLSASSRIWFLVGEIFMFTTAVIISFFKINQSEYLNEN